MTNLLVKLFIKNSENYNDCNIREKYGFLSSFVCIVVNIILFILKYILGTLSNSLAIIADAFNNLGDVGSSIVTFIGFKMASMPADDDHPFGHGRIEYLSGLIISLLTFFVGYEILSSSIHKIMNPTPLQTNYFILAGLVVSILLKLWLYIFNKNLGKKINSTTMAATAQDSLNDCVSTFAASISIIVAMAMEINIDGYLGLVVSFYILYSAYQLTKETIDPLLGKLPDKELVNQIHEILLGDEIVYGVHDLIVHDYGPGRVSGSAHVEVDAKCDFIYAHDTIDNLEKAIQEITNMPFVLHLDPVTTDNQKVNHLKNEIIKIITDIHKDMSIHDFRIVEGNTHTNIIFDLLLPKGYREKTSILKEEIDKKVEKIDETFYTVITFDRTYL